MRKWERRGVESHVMCRNMWRTSENLGKVVYVTNANDEDKLYVLATSSPDSPLGRLWKQVFEEGKKIGYSEGTKLVNGLEIDEITRIGVERGNRERDRDRKGLREACVGCC